MKGDKISIMVMFECLYIEGTCKYKNPENRYCCIGCRYSILKKQTPTVISSQIVSQGER